MKQIYRIALFSYLLLVGCDHVQLNAPFGARTLNERLISVVGRWTDEEHNIFEIRQSKSGELVGGHLSWDDTSQRFVANSDGLDVRTENDAEYLFVKSDETFDFLRVELKADNEILLYVPDPKSFRAAVNEGLLTGTVENRKGSDNFTVRLTTDDKLKTFLARPDWRKNYLQDVVVRYRRLPAPQQGRTTH